jgi:hypothetical protein
VHVIQYFYGDNVMYARAYTRSSRTVTFRFSKKSPNWKHQCQRCQVQIIQRSKKWSKVSLSRFIYQILAYNCVIISHEFRSRTLFILDSRLLESAYFEDWWDKVTFKNYLSNKNIFKHSTHTFFKKGRLYYLCRGFPIASLILISSHIKYVNFHRGVAY